MTLAVRSSVMEHYRSTLATTAIAVFGLVVAAHTLHPGNYEVQPRPVRTEAAQAAPSTWMDPPARMAVTSRPEPTISETARAAAADLLTPRMAAALPPGAVTAPALPSALVAPVEKARKTLVANRMKVADRAPAPRRPGPHGGRRADRRRRTDAGTRAGGPDNRSDRRPHPRARPSPRQRGLSGARLRRTHPRATGRGWSASSSGGCRTG
jgi:hypothetical protein